jgi:photosystem II stability/assembly factor-like uncharacterized protein
MKKGLLISTLILFFGFISQGYAQESYLIKVSPVTPEKIKLLSNSGIKVYAKAPNFYLAEASAKDLEFLKDSGLSYKILDTEPGFSLYYFVWAKPGGSISKHLTKIKEKAMILEVQGERALIKGDPRRIEELTASGLSIKLIRKKPLPIKPEEEFPFLVKRRTLAYDPLINEIMQKVTTSELYEWVADLSGEYSVTIGGSADTLITRNTYTDKCDRAAQYIKESFESFGLTAWYDTCTVPSVFPYYVMDIVSTPDGNTAWLGCANSGVWKTTDAGNHWYYINGTNVYFLWALTAPTPDTLYGAGNEGKIIKSTDGGNSWFELSGPTTDKLRGAYFESSQTGWVTGYAGTIYLTTNGGQAWINQSTGTNNLFEITFGDANNGWIVGQNGTILHTSNRGTDWVSQASGATGTIFGVDFATPHKGWVCGENGYLGYTTNAGANWNTQNSGTNESFYMVSAPDSLHAWVVGLYGMVLNTTDAGNNWLALNNASGLFYEVYFLDTLKGWITGFNEIHYTTNAGQNWSSQMDNICPRVTKYNVVAVLPGQTEPRKECLITAHYDDIIPSNPPSVPGADDNASGIAAVLTAAHILRDFDFDYTLKFVCFVGEEQGGLGSDAYAQNAQQRGDTIVGVYNFDMIAWEGDNNNIIELHAGTGSSSGALADIMMEVINDYSLPLDPHKITSGSTVLSDHASFWDQGYPAILGIEDMTNDFNPYYHSANDLITYFDFSYFTNITKAGVASLSILAQPFKYGDANGDRQITITDVVYLINYLFKGGPPSNHWEAADANCDGKVSVSDVVYLINYIFKGGPPPR